jgi:hypothetical protein
MDVKIIKLAWRFVKVRAKDFKAYLGAWLWLWPEIERWPARGEGFLGLKSRLRGRFLALGWSKEKYQVVILVIKF